MHNPNFASIVTILLCLLHLNIFSQTCNILSPVVNEPVGSPDVTVTIIDDVPSVVPPCVGSIDNLANVINSDLLDSTTVNITGAQCSAEISVEYDTPTPSGSFAAFEISADGLLTGMGAIQSTVTIKTLLNGNVVDSSEAVTAIMGLDSADLLINGHALIGFISESAFDEIRIAYNSLMPAPFTNDIFNASVLKFCPGPNLICDTDYIIQRLIYPIMIDPLNSGSSVNCVGCAVNNARQTLSADTNDFATISIPIAAPGSGSISVQNALDTYLAGSTAGFVIEDLNNILLLDLFESIEVCTYLDDTVQECASGTDLVSVSLIVPLIQPRPGIVNVGFETLKPYDEIQLTVNSLVSINNEIRVYSPFIDTRNNSTVAFVDPNSTGLGTGLLWEDAFTAFDNVLNSCLDEVDTILAAEGTYFPNHNDRDLSFEFPEGATIIGGFSNQGMYYDPSGANTILCGDIGLIDVADDNLFHIIRIPANVTDFSLSGFTLSCGYADGPSPLQQKGAGILVLGEGEINNVIIDDNYSLGEGSAIHVEGNGKLIINNSLVTSDNSSDASIRVSADSGSQLDINPQSTIEND